MKRYHKVIHIMFWALFAGVTAFVAWFASNHAKPFDLSIWMGQEPQERTIIKKEPVIIKEIEKETLEWFYFIATAYSANDPLQGTDSTTFTGKEVYEGVIAVDPDMIPLGSLVEIKDMGFFVADDIGGKIKGNKVDIFFPSKDKAIDFGKQQVWLRIIGEDLPVQLADFTSY